MKEHSQKIATNTRTICYCGAMVALIAASSQIMLPIPFSPAPISISILMILLCGILSPSTALFSVVAYVLLGAIGLPVFAGFKGSEALVSATAGYIIGYIPTAFAAGFVFKHLRHPISVFFGLCGAITLCYICGTIYFALYLPTDLGNALMLCVLPFIPFDALKAVVATIAGLRLRRSLKRLM